MHGVVPFIALCGDHGPLSSAPDCQTEAIKAYSAPGRAGRMRTVHACWGVVSRKVRGGNERVTWNGARGGATSRVGG